MVKNVQIDTSFSQRNKQLSFQVKYTGQCKKYHLKDNKENAHTAHTVVLDDCVKQPPWDHSLSPETTEL